MSEDLIRGCACGFVHKPGDCREDARTGDTSKRNATTQCAFANTATWLSPRMSTLWNAPTAERPLILIDRERPG